MGFSRDPHSYFRTTKGTVLSLCHLHTIMFYSTLEEQVNALKLLNDLSAMKPNYLLLILKEY